MLRAIASSRSGDYSGAGARLVFIASLGCKTLKFDADYLNAVCQLRSAAAFALMLLATGCGLAPTSGPSPRAILSASSATIGDARIRIVDVSDELTRSLIVQARPRLFSDVLGEGLPVGTVIGRGDVLDISIWEAPPAALFGATGGDPRMTSSGSTARGTTIPEQMVDSDGRIVMPFVGTVNAAGRTLKQLEEQIAARLVGKAHEPQALVRLTRNASTMVTVVGEVAGSARVPLTPKGERLLDVLASVGGTKPPVGKTTIQITRGGRVASLPLDVIIRDPQQNIRLQPDDVVTALFQPYSFTALGAAGRNEEIPFEATGLTLSQALGRVAGLQDARANAKGIFIFRFEDPGALLAEQPSDVHTTSDGKVPVIYRIDLSDARSLFVAQSFPMHNKDILYVSNAPLADIQKFVNVIYSSILPVATVATLTP